MMGPVDQDRQVVMALFQEGNEVMIFLKSAPPLEDALSLGWIVPQIRCGRSFLELRELIDWTGCVKDSSASRRLVSQGLDSVESVRLVLLSRVSSVCGCHDSSS